ncbi:MAG TPA: YIP1 family protein [Blastocatellia bacterium]|nr:YIP1 family protein [Blastocatellia bacterium]
MDAETNYADATPSPAAGSTGPMGRLIGTLISPIRTFEEIDRRPTWIAPILIAISINVAFTLFYDWRVKPNFERAIRRQITTRTERMGGEMPSQDELDRQVRLGVSFAKWTPVIVTISTPLIYAFLSGLLALGMLLLRADTTYKKILSVYAWTSASIGLLALGMMTATLMVKDSESLRAVDILDRGSISASNLGAIFRPADPFVRSLLGSLDIFSIWSLVVLSIGLAAVGGSAKVTRSKTAAMVFASWLIWVVIKAGLASMGFQL